MMHMFTALMYFVSDLIIIRDYMILKTQQDKAKQNDAHILWDML